MVILRFFKVFWFLSALVALVVLLLVYANLPQQVVIQEREAKLLMLSQDAVFYISVAILAVINVMVFGVSKLFKDEEFRVWFYGLVMTINLFFIISLSLVSTFNSGEKFDYGRIDFVIYGSVGLIILWALFWPFYSIYRKIFRKPTV